MFTGLITDVGRVRGLERRGDTRIVIETHFDPDGIEEGASIACSGACLTVVDKGRSDAGAWFAVDVSAETLARTALGDWRDGAPVNLERSLRLGDELGGHIVTGHVDGVGTIESIRPEGDSFRYRFRLPEGLSAFVASKGSIAVNGVSLTVNEVEGDCFGVNIIPFTRKHTTFEWSAEGDRVNVEIDLLARYVARLTETRALWPTKA
jgi:riboflavin synthase